MIALVRVIVNQIKEKLKNPQMFFLVLLVLFINTQVTDGLRSNAVEVNGKINTFEPFIAITNSAIMQIIIPVVYILIMHDFPHVFGKYYFYTIRIGRKRWLHSQIAFSTMFSFLYVAFIYIISNILLVERIVFSSQWSDSVVLYEQLHRGEYNSNAMLITPAAFYQGTVVEVFLYSFVLLVLYMVTINLLQIVFYTYGLKYMGNIICIAIGILGAIMNFVSEKLKWMFPTSNSVFFYHFEKYIGKPKFQISYSILYFAILTTLLLLICERKIKVAILYDSSEEY